MTQKLSNGGTYYGPSWLYELGQAFHNTESWLYGEWSKEKYDVYLASRGLDPSGLVGNYFDYLLSKRSDEEYLRNNGMTYSDIHDPRKLSQGDAAIRVYGSAYRMIGKNIDKLYR